MLGSKESRKVYASCLASEWGLMRADALPDPKERPSLDKLLDYKLSFEVTSLPSDYEADMMLPQSDKFFEHDLLRLPRKYKSERLKGSLYLVCIPEESEPNWITRVDLKRPKEYIEEYLLATCDSIIDSRRKHGLKQERQKKRLRLDQWIDYIKVYDLREECKKYLQIAEELWGEAEGDIERKARLYYQKAKNLIDKPPIRKIILDRYYERTREK